MSALRQLGGHQLVSLGVGDDTSDNRQKTFAKWTALAAAAIRKSPISDAESETKEDYGK